MLDTNLIVSSTYSLLTLYLLSCIGFSLSFDAVCNSYGLFPWNTGFNFLSDVLFESLLRRALLQWHDDLLQMTQLNAVAGVQPLS